MFSVGQGGRQEVKLKGDEMISQVEMKWIKAIDRAKESGRPAEEIAAMRKRLEKIRAIRTRIGQ